MNYIIMSVLALIVYLQMVQIEQVNHSNLFKKVVIVIGLLYILLVPLLILMDISNFFGWSGVITTTTILIVEISLFIFVINNLPTSPFENRSSETYE
ncbi:hypothetical protein [Aquisalibacillus elongatus]|uniref:Uncharacterized protein n=1 Tax=Aquisalibacillus elongatus TaxID=485577 RepID=A0A3N5BJQ8_9BACI|nr:hypothetical protein [Aquisalibacillus elongatus]RPF55490.1 hypothetical protein EDC24_0368 [Aquisalibacillus elongatus]